MSDMEWHADDVVQAVELRRPGTGFDAPYSTSVECILMRFSGIGLVRWEGAENAILNDDPTEQSGLPALCCKNRTASKVPWKIISLGFGNKSSYPVLVTWFQDTKTSRPVCRVRII